MIHHIFISYFQIRAVLIGLALSGVKCQQNDQSQYVGSINGGFVPFRFDNVQQNQNEFGPASGGSVINTQQQAQPNTFVDNNNIDEFIASVPVPSPTPSFSGNPDPVINNNNNFAASNNKDFNNPFPINNNNNQDFNNPFPINNNNNQDFNNAFPINNNNNQDFNNPFPINNNNNQDPNNPFPINNNNQDFNNPLPNNNNSNNQVFNINNNNLANTAPATDVASNDGVNFPVTSTPVINNNNNNFAPAPVITNSPVVVTNPPVINNLPVVTNPPAVINRPVATNPPVIVTNPPVVITTSTFAPLQVESRQQSCYVRSCDQSISGRNLEYNRALQIVQNEEYLSAADLSVIRRRKRHIWSKPATQTKQETEAELVDSLILSPVHNIAKRSSDFCFSQYSNSTTCIPVATGALTTGLMAIIFAGAKLVSYFGARNRPAPAQSPVQVKS
jgi:hypothetical protein